MRAPKLILHPNPILKETCRPVVEFDADLNILAGDLVDLMHAGGHGLKGVGLSAPQGGFAIRLFVMEPDLGRLRICVNPGYAPDESTGYSWGDEGCLSLPGVIARKRRAKKIRATYQDIEGNHRSIELEGFAARIFQHEYDHMDGILITDPH